MSKEDEYIFQNFLKGLKLEKIAKNCPCKNLGPMRESVPQHFATSWTLAPVASQTALIALIELIR